MKKKFLIFCGIFITLSLSRFIPHPPNFTTLVALSFYVPVILGRKYIFYLVLSFVITDILIGYHNTTQWTWGSVIFIGILSSFFKYEITHRICGALFSALLFYLITNFGVWTTGLYAFTAEGLLECFIMAIPFFGYSLISTLFFSVILESILLIFKININRFQKILNL